MTTVVRNRDEAVIRAHVLAREWARTAADRDADGSDPVDEVAALAASGLLGISIPCEYGGAGLSPSEVAEIIVILTSADVALSQVPQNHFDFVDVLSSAGNRARTFFYGEVLAGKRFGNALAEFGPDGERTLGARLRLVDEGHYVLSGRKVFATGALSADWIPVNALLSDDSVAIAYVERQAAGVEVIDDWDAFGQRATRSGTVVLTDVCVPADHVVARGSDGNGLLAAAQAAGNFLIHAAIALGGAHQVLDTAREAAASGSARATTFVERWEVPVRLADIAVTRAGRLTDAAVAHPVSRAGIIESHVAVSLAKVRAFRLSVEMADDFFASGVGDVSGAARLDRMWRNARVHTLHDGISQRVRDVGRYVITGQYPKTNSQLLEISEL